MDHHTGTNEIIQEATRTKTNNDSMNKSGLLGGKSHEFSTRRSDHDQPTKKKELRGNGILNKHNGICGKVTRLERTTKTSELTKENKVNQKQQVQEQPNQDKPFTRGMQQFKHQIRKCGDGLAKAASASRKRLVENHMAKQRQASLSSSSPPPQGAVVRSLDELRRYGNDLAKAASASRKRLLENHHNNKLLQPKQERKQMAFLFDELKEPECDAKTTSNLTKLIDTDKNEQNNNNNTLQSDDPLIKTSNKDNHTNMGHAINDWYKSFMAVLYSQEMLTLQFQTKHLIHTFGRASIATIFLPITLFIPQQHKKLIHDGQSSVTSSPLSVVATTTFINILAIPGFAWNLLGQVSTQAASDLLSVVIPPERKRGQHNRRCLQPYERDRLRLDYNVGESTSPQQQSSYLLCMIDLSVTEVPSCKEIEIQEIKQRIVAYIDLARTKHGTDDALIRKATDRLVFVGLGMLSDNPIVRLPNSELYESKISINWNCEGSTARLLREMQKQNVSERLNTMQSQSLVWSGTYSKSSTYKNINNLSDEDGRQFSMYLARGVLPFSTMEMLQLLWSNSRTSEYNKFCLCRKTLFDLLDSNDERIKNGTADTGTKVIQSETRVPFTSSTVKVQCLMHCRPLPSGGGYVIITRSLRKGTAGTLYREFDNKNTIHRHVVPNSNEILWNMNVIRRVANHPHLTDLTTLSQVGYSLGIPRFLATQIALNGVDRFFTNVRNLKPEGGLC